MKAKKSAETNNRLIQTHSSAIQITHKLSLVQHKAWLVLLRNASREIPNPNIKKHTIRLSELATYLGYTNNRNDGYFKEILEGLVDTKVSWNILSKDDGAEWGIASMLAGCRVKNGVVEYDYSSFLREKLYNPKMFALLNLKMLNQFSSKYSLVIYNLCKDYEGAGRTPFMELSLFRELMGLEESEYPTFKSLNRRVIKEPMEEVNEVSDILVKVEYAKEKRRVVGLQFMIKKNPQLKFDIKEMGGDDERRTGKVAEEESLRTRDTLYKRILSFGLSEKQALKYLDACDPVYISQNLDVVDKERKAGKVKNLPAYTVKALEEDFRPHRGTVVEAESREKEKETARKKKLALIEKELEAFRAEKLDNLLANLSGKERAELEESFMAENADNIFVTQRYAEDGFGNVIIQGAFRDYARRRLFGEFREAEEFEERMKAKGLYTESMRKEIAELFGGRETVATEARRQ